MAMYVQGIDRKPYSEFNQNLKVFRKGTAKSNLSEITDITAEQKHILNQLGLEPDNF